MVSAGALLLIAAFVGVCCANPMKRDAVKCKMSPEDEAKATAGFLGCYEEVNGRPFSMDDIDEDDFTDEKLGEIAFCYAKDAEIVSPDGSTYYPDVAKKGVDDMIADPEVKEAIKAEIDRCAAAGGDAKTAFLCSSEFARDACE